MVDRSFDILVIGSGMGGLVAAALLAHEGLKPLVVEALPRIGGRCSTVQYKGFKCTTGVIGVEIGGPVEEVFRRVGARFDLRPAGPPRYLINGQIHQIGGGGGLKKLLSAASTDQSEVTRLEAAFSQAMKMPEPMGMLSLKQWLLKHTANKNILDVFQTMVAATLMVNSDEISADEFFRFLTRLGGITDFGICPGGSISLPEALVEIIREHEGEVWTGCSAKGILVENGTARGALLSNQGKEIRVSADMVISNIGPRQTVKLAGKNNFDKAYLTRMEQNMVPAAVMLFQIASDEPLLDDTYRLVTGARRVNALFQPTRLCPELAPPGKHLLLAGAGAGSSIPPLEPKKELELCVQDLRDLVPHFDTRAQILLAGCYHRGWPGMHCWPGRDLPTKTSVTNLYNVGDGAKPSGTTGLPSTAASAMEVVELVRMRL